MLAYLVLIGAEQPLWSADLIENSRIASAVANSQSGQSGISLTKLEAKLAPEGEAAKHSAKGDASQLDADLPPRFEEELNSRDYASGLAISPWLDGGEEHSKVASVSNYTSQNPGLAYANVSDQYPIIDKMEILTFGSAWPELKIDARLSALEQAVFKKVYNNETLFDRSQRLRVTILGTTDDLPSQSGLTDFTDVPMPLPQGLLPFNQESPEVNCLDEIAQRKENLESVDEAQLSQFALDLVNYLRRERGVVPLSWDNTAKSMAAKQVAELVRRNVISHANEKGDNPDMRYTALGGTDVITENLTSLPGEKLKMPRNSKALVALLIKNMMAKQDDRDALLLPDATGFGFAMEWPAAKPRLIACIEVSTKHGIMQPIALPITVGDHLELKGLIQEPYRFDRITLAWEGANSSMDSAADEAEDALPYFPPLDYVAYASKAEHDYDKAMTTLRTVGIIAAIAGGVFMPPVALAAPMIAATGGLSEPRALSDIPVHGGVKVEGLTFSGRVPLAHDGKEGVYYVTVWASNGKAGKPIPISRRAYLIEQAPALGNIQSASPDRAKKRSSHKRTKEQS